MALHQNRDIAARDAEFLCETNLLFSRSNALSDFGYLGIGKFCSMVLLAVRHTSFLNRIRKIILMSTDRQMSRIAARRVVA